MALDGRELCACQIIELLGLAPSTVSRHMALLRQARLVKTRKKGRWMYYRLADESAPAEVASALAWVRSSLRQDERIRADAKRLKSIRAVDRDVLCSRHAPSAAMKT